MPRRVFVSYCHAQGDWVRDRLVSCLRAAGAEVLIDVERFEAGRGLVGQMDATQDRAHVSVLVLSPEYLASAACRHEMGRAIARDPAFANGATIPIQRLDCALPDAIRVPDPLWVDLRDDGRADRWEALFAAACEGGLGIDAPAWLAARDRALESECRFPGEWDYLYAFRRQESLPPPAEPAIERSLRRRLLVAEEGDRWRLRVPLMARWLRQRA